MFQWHAIFNWKQLAYISTWFKISLYLHSCSAWRRWHAFDDSPQHTGSHQSGVLLPILAPCSILVVGHTLDQHVLEKNRTGWKLSLIRIISLLVFRSDYSSPSLQHRDQCTFSFSIQTRIFSLPFPNFRSFQLFHKKKKTGTKFKK